MKIVTFNYLAYLLFTVSCITASYANVPGGGTGTGANVTVTDNGSTVVLNNGIVSITITKSSATITSFTFKGMNLLAGGHGGGSFYWTWNMPNLGGPANCKYTLTADPSANGGDYAEVHLSSPWSGDTGTGAMDVDIYYSLTRGAQGYYVTAIPSHPATYPDNPGGEWRCNTYIGSIFDWLSVDSTRNRLMATPADFAAGSAVSGAPKEVVLLNTGIYKGQYECKYSYSADLGDLSVWGWTSTSKKVGIWMTVPSHEYYNGGPMKRELTGHNGHTLLNMLGGQHYGMGGNFDMPAGTAFQKTYGPFFIYANSYSGSSSDPDVTVANSLWKDAQAQAAAEQGAWPYTWFNNTAYVQESGRGTATGVLKVTDNGVTSAAANCWIGLAPDDNGTDFQLQARTYQFWVKTDSNGNFKIPHILPGTYNLWAFGPAATGTFKQANVTITAGQTFGLGTVNWTSDRVAPTVWEIGTPDRDTKEFLNGHRVSFKQDTLPPYAIWGTFAKLPQEFPNGLTYTVGQSNAATGWNYAQPTIYDSATAAYNSDTWKVKFNLSKAPTAGAQASIYMAFAADYQGPVIVTVNGTNITSPTTGFFPTNASDAMIRLGSHGAFSDQRITFSSSLLKAGANEIDFNMRKGGSNGNFAMYDYVRLECSGLTQAPTATITAGGPTTFCQGGSVVLSANTGTGYTYQWNKNSATISGATNSAYTVTASGSYTVTVTASGLSTTSSATVITVNTLPAATITPATSTSFCQGGNVVLSAGTGTGLTYQWNNGTIINGTTSSSYTATTAGTYTVTVKNSNGCSATSAGTTVTVNSLPVITPYVQVNGNWLQQNTAQACAGNTIAIGPQPVIANGWTWTGPNNYTSALRQISLTNLTATQGGVYTASYTDANGCKASANFTVTVNAIPSAPIVNSPVTYCQNTTATALIASGSSLKWYSSSTGGTASTTDPTPSTAAAGTISYYVSQTVNTCESARSTIAVTVNAPPTVSNAGTNQNITTTTAQLSANVPSSGTGMWSVVNGTGTFANTALASTTISGLSTGVNVLQWTISAGLCTPSSSTVTINVGTAPVQQTITGLSYVPANKTGVTYSVQANAGSIYQWTVPSGATITSTSTNGNEITVSFGAGGGNVTVTETNNFGSATSTLPVTVGNSPAQQTITGSSSVNSNTSSTYTITTPSGVTNHWSVPAGTTITYSNADSSQIAISFGTTGGTVSVTQTNSFGSTVDSEIVNVGNSPATQTISGPTTISAGSTGVSYSVPDNSSSSYHWTLPQGTTITSANADSSQITVNFGSQGGTVAVTETNSFGSTTDALYISVTGVTGTITGYSQDSYELRPNPFTDYTTIVLHNNNNDRINLNVLDVEGVILFASSDYYTNQEIMLGNNLTSGVYFVKLLYGSEIRVIKIVKL